jgi:signal transduction histidine kinase
VNATHDLTLAGLVHDLRNVFETLGDAAELLRDDTRWAALAGTIERAVEQGRRVTASLQDSVRPLDLGAILENAVQYTRDFVATSRHAEAKITLRADPNIRLVGRTGQWERVFVNLLLNSAQAISGTAEIEIVAHRTAGGIEILIADNGPGIPDEILSQVFTPGFSTRDRQMGMGLSIVSAIVAENGGRVMAGNRTGGGAQFRIEVPDTPAGSGASTRMERDEP